MVAQTCRGNINNELEEPRERTREGEREAAGKGRGTDHDDRHSKKNGRICKTEEKRELVDLHIEEFASVSSACEAFGIAPSSYYYKSKINPATKDMSDEQVRDLIEDAHKEFWQYGYRRLHHFFEKKKGITINEKRIRRIMTKYSLKAMIWRGWKIKTTDSNHCYGYADNLLPGMELTGVNQVWVTDITYIRVRSGFVYLAVVIDLFSRKVVGWAISSKIDTDLCLTALNDAIEQRKPSPGLIHHSDRGVQYASHEYKERLERHGIVPSMSAKGYCYDNAFAETFFKTLKAEEVYLTEYESINDVLKAVPRFIEDVYNDKRLHSSLGYFSPAEFEAIVERKQLKKHGLQETMNLR